MKDAFLALDVDFWSPDGRRYTVFLDPGRVKRGILPNDQFGRALSPGIASRSPSIRAGATRTASRWRRRSAHDFGVGPADMAPIRLEDWRIHAPAAGTRDPLVVTFPKPLDHGLLQRALGVATGGATLDGDDRRRREGETEWRFTPRAAVASRRYDLVVLSILEDPMGNKIGRPFDIDTFERDRQVAGAGSDDAAVRDQVETESMKAVKKMKSMKMTGL